MQDHPGSDLVTAPDCRAACVVAQLYIHLIVGSNLDLHLAKAAFAGQGVGIRVIGELVVVVAKNVSAVFVGHFNGFIIVHRDRDAVVGYFIIRIGIFWGARLDVQILCIHRFRVDRTRQRSLRIAAFTFTNCHTVSTRGIGAGKFHIANAAASALRGLATCSSIPKLSRPARSFRVHRFIK